MNSPTITPCLWFAGVAQEAVDFYIGIFPDSRIIGTSYYPASDHPAHEGLEGKVLTIEFELAGQRFTALNAGDEFQFTEAISLQIPCETQEEIDYYWNALNEGGDPSAQQCGWLKDRYGLSWQVFPKIMIGLLQDADSDRAKRAFDAMLTMKKFDLGAIEAAVAYS